VPLVLGDVRLDVGQFPDLVTQGFRVAAGQPLAAPSAFRRLQPLHVVTLVGGDQGTLVFRMPRLPAAFLLRFAPLSGGLACGCCVLGGSEEFSGVLPCPCRSSSSTRASNSAILAKSARIIA
jgi:hypothetical protein